MVLGESLLATWSWLLSRPNIDREVKKNLEGFMQELIACIFPPDCCEASSRVGRSYQDIAPYEFNSSRTTSPKAEEPKVQALLGNVCDVASEQHRSYHQ